MKQKVIFLISIIIFNIVSAQNKIDIVNYKSQKSQYGFIENKGQIYDQNFLANSDVKYLCGSGGTTYSWTPATDLSCSDCANPIANPTSTTTYILVITDANGCSNVDTVIVFVEMDCGEVFVPNVFSPNQDGENDLECVYGRCIQTILFAIYDRWGEKVFETSDPDACWDGIYKGKLMNTAVFVYYLNATLLNGEDIKKQGNITLIR
jgi:gliding motility-associated-like protein